MAAVTMNSISDEEHQEDLKALYEAAQEHTNPRTRATYASHERRFEVSPSLRFPWSRPLLARFVHFFCGAGLESQGKPQPTRHVRKERDKVLPNALGQRPAGISCLHRRNERAR